jgi:glycosyltransferase involved in cell wall biosynthesis
MKIYYLINSLKKGGAERQILTLQNEFGGEIILLENSIEYQIDKSVKVISLCRTKANTFFNKFLRYFNNILKLLRIVKSNKGENEIIVISFLEQSNILNIICSIFSGHKTIISSRINLKIQYKEYPWFLFILKYLYRMADLVTANSKGLVEQIVQDFGIVKTKAIYVPNAYNVELIKSKSSEVFADSSLEDLIINHPFLLSVNRLEEQKLIDEQIIIFSILKAKFKGIKLVIAGEGPLKNDLVQLAEEKGNQVYDHESKEALSDKYDIYLIGLTNNPFRLYKYTKAFLLTSKYESMPNSLCEAMICNAPIFAADCQFGPREILRTGEPQYHQQLDDINASELLGNLLPIPDLDYTDWIKSLSNHFSFLNPFVESKQYTDRIEDFDTTSAMKTWKSILNN